MKQIPHFINNKSTESIDGKTFDSINPSTQKIWAKASLGSKSDTEKAVKAARDAFDNGPWPKMTAKERSVFLHKIADLIEKNIDELAEIETTDMGKPITQSRGKDIPRTVDNFRFFADYITLTEDESFPMSNNFHIYTRYEPVGVVAAISPWNFPIMLASWKIAPALAFGNTVVLKPAEQTPVSCYRLAEIAAEAGIPEGVLNVIHGFGPGSAGEYLTTNPDVDLVTFTGESNTARAIQKAVAPTLKGVSFELGGKGANIVFDDADIKKAADMAVASKFRNNGQVCISPNRFYIHENKKEEFVNLFVEKTKKLKIGNGMEPDVQLGPITTKKRLNEIEELVETTKKEGGKILLGGKRPSGFNKGYFFEPTIFDDVKDHFTIMKIEPFGPLVPMLSFKTFDEVVERANKHELGLASYICTNSMEKAHKASELMETGTVAVNTPVVAIAEAPFGGIKQAGYGREGGSMAIKDYLNVKYTHLGIKG